MTDRQLLEQIHQQLSAVISALLAHGIAVVLPVIEPKPSTRKKRTEADVVVMDRTARQRLQQEARAVKQESRRDQLDRIALRCAARPILDQRSADEICGYDAKGLPC